MKIYFTSSFRNNIQQQTKHNDTLMIKDEKNEGEDVPIKEELLSQTETGELAEKINNSLYNVTNMFNDSGEFNLNTDENNNNIIGIQKHNYKLRSNKYLEYWQCHICKLQFYRFAKNLICMVCTVGERKFNQRNTLIKHLDIHSDEKKYKCETCGKSN